MSEERSLTAQVYSEDGTEYDAAAGEKLAKWIFSLNEHCADHRKKVTRESEWANDWKFIGGAQWSGNLPTYRLRVVLNFWRRALHQALAVLTGDRPIIKLVPGGKIDQKVFEVWQHAFWSACKTQGLMKEYTSALMWALCADGGWIKTGWGRRGPAYGDYQEPMDVLLASRHPRKIYPDTDCTDYTLEKCAYLLDRDVLDLGVITSRYPEQGHRVKPDTGVSMKWPDDKAEDWVDTSANTISPAANWTANREYRRAKAEIVEAWMDDSTLERRIVDKPAPLPLQLAASMAGVPPPPPTKEYEWVPKYPFGRLITCSRDVVLRDIPNPVGRAFGWARRWPYVYVPGAHEPDTLFRQGLLADQRELQRLINKTLSLLGENAIKVSSAMIIADELAMDDEDWDLLTLVPGVKIRKRTATEFKVVFPEALPEYMMKLPDILGQKLEASLGIQDPSLPQGQAVAARTVQFLMSKGNFLLGALAEMGDNALARVGERVFGLMRQNYLPGREIPLFEGERMQDITAYGTLSELPPSLQVRVEPSSGWAEIMAVMAQTAQMESNKRK